MIPVDVQERTAQQTLDAVDLRQQFPLLQKPMRGQPLVFLDNASTTQKPVRVLDAERHFYETMNANIHRGVYELSEQATEAYVDAHRAVARFIGAAAMEEIIFTRNTTESLNLIAHAWALPRLKPGDRILLTAMEHHSNIVPWQQVARARGAVLEFVELTPQGLLDLADLDDGLQQKPIVLAVTHISNVVGTVNPLAEIIARAHAAGTVVVVDAAQSAGRMPLNVREWDADFVAFSGHKMYGPTGIGVLYGKRALLEQAEPFFTGGDMVKVVSRTNATWNDLPWKFEAGTPNIAGGVALGEAVRFLEEVDIARIWEHEQGLVRHALPRLQEVPGLKLLGPVAAGVAMRAGVFSFTMQGIHSHDLASFLDERGIAIRGGHHCAQPLLTTLGMSECARASVGVYTTVEDMDRLVMALHDARGIFR